MKHLKLVFGIVLFSWLFILNGCGGGSGGGTGAAPSPTPSGAVPVVTAFSINNSAAVTTGNQIALTLPFGTNVTALTVTFTAPGSIVTVGGVPQISGVTTNDFTQPVVYTITRISSSTSASLKASTSNVTTYTVTVTVASISAKAITAFSLAPPSSTTITPGIISVTDIAVTVPFGTNVKSLIATFTTSGQSVKVNGVTQVSGTTQNDFTSPVTYTVTAADGTTQNYIVTVTVASASANDIISFSLNGTPGVISSGGLSQNIVVKVPFGTNVNGMLASFITTGTNVAVNGVTQISGATQNDFTNPVTYIVTSANGIVQTYTVTVVVSIATSNFINAYSFGNISGVISGQNITVTVPFGTNVTALIPTFTITGVNITVGGITQTSTVTPNDFTNPVTYTVTAGDGTTGTYVVTVTVASASAKAITAFSFGTNVGVISGQNIVVNMPFGTDVTSLIATFTTTGTNVSVNGVTQVSGTTLNNFTNPVSYVVTAADGSTATYIVTVSVASSSAKAITAYSLAGTPGVITGFNIAVTLPFGTDTTLLVATFTTTGASVTINGVTEFSGTTSNSFTNPVTYIVTAADGTTATYTVTVTVSPGSAKAITAFSVSGTAGTINQSQLTITDNIQFGTSVTSLVATFTTTGNSVTVNGVTQTSGATSNNFTSPVTYVVTAGDGSTASYTVTVNATANVWTWMSGSNTTNVSDVYGTKGVTAPSNAPGNRDTSISWTDTTGGNLWFFGGNQLDSSGTVPSLKSDLWKYNISSGFWTWVSGVNTANTVGTYGTKGTPSTSNIPGARQNSISWIDASGNLWLFGGYGYDSVGGTNSLNDLWKYNPSTNQWTWVSGSNLVNQTGVYGTQGTPLGTNIPGARSSGVSWIDSSGNLWLFGGSGCDSVDLTCSVELNDVWKYNTSTGFWTWISGSNVGNQVGTYGTLGVPSTSNIPGARANPVAWIDTSGNLWLFGGIGFDTSFNGYLNDLWKFNPSTGQWTWVSGSNVKNQRGTYGTQGVGSVSNIPGGRYLSVSWIDGSGNFWLYGGSGRATSIALTTLGDLWKYTPSNNQWTWVGGANSNNPSSVYGTLGVPNSNNIPGGRFSSMPWTDSSGNLWLFGGANPSFNDLNDLWRYHP